MTNKELDDLWEKIENNPNPESQECKDDFELYLEIVNQRMILMREIYKVNTK